MKFPEPDMDRDAAMKLWERERSRYARDQVILSNIGLVKVAIKSLGMSMLDEDLHSIGIVGLIKALDGFDPDLGNKFSTYAVPAIKHAIIRALRKKSIPIDYSLDAAATLDNGDFVEYKDMVSNGKDFEKEIVAICDMKHAIQNLSETDMSILRLRVADGKNQCQIAKALGISQAQVSRKLKMIAKEIGL